MIAARVKRLLYENQTLGHWGFELVRLVKREKDRFAPMNLESVPLLRRLRGVGFSPDTIVDVGANRGEWARNAKAVFSEANYVLIEPQEEMRPFLDRFCRENPGSKWFLSGAGASEGELTLTVWDNLAGSSFVPGEIDDADSRTQRRVPIVTLDALIERGEMPVPDLVKMDVQGFELEVMRGAQRCVGQTEVFILEAALFEFMPGRPLLHDLTAYMADHGYVTYDYGGFLRRPYDGALSHVDVCFARADGVLRASQAWG